MKYVDENKKLAKEIKSALKLEQEKTEASKFEFFWLRITQIESQSRRFQDVWIRYNTSQMDYREKTKAILIKQAKIIGKNTITEEEIEKIIDEGEMVSLYEVNNMALEKRNDELTEIELRLFFFL